MPTLTEKPLLGGPTKLERKKGPTPSADHIEPPPKSSRTRKSRVRRKAARARKPAPSTFDIDGDSIVFMGGALIFIGLLLAYGQQTVQAITGIAQGLARVINTLIQGGRNG